MKATNLSSGNPEPYLACPHCLTEIATQENPSNPERSPDTENPKPIQDTTTLAQEKMTQGPTKTQCTHHLGYLSERTNKEKIPEECITCADILNCMLKTLKNKTKN